MRNDVRHQHGFLFLRLQPRSALRNPDRLPEVIGLNSAFNLLDIGDELAVIYRVKEESFISSMKPTADALFISFSGAEALITAGTKISMETIFSHS